MEGKHTTVSAVHDGYALQKSVVHSPLGRRRRRRRKVFRKSEDQRCGHRCAFRSEEETKSVWPEFEVKAVNHPKTTASYAAFKRLEIMEDIKATVCRLDDHVFNSDEHKNVSGDVHPDCPAEYDRSRRRAFPDS